MKQSGNTILMTGGGSGIGAGLAQRFHDAGNTVIVAGRRREALEQTVAGRANMHAVVLDVSDPASITAFAQDVIARFPALNVLFNNAGIMKLEPLDTARDLSVAEATIETNLLGPIRLIDAFVEHLCAQPDAAIVNVTSGLAFVPLVAAATYSASKAALHSYTVSLRMGLEGKVEVIELAPPAVQTGLTPGQETRPGYQPLPEFIEQVMAKFTQQPTPEEVVVDRAVGLRNAEAEGRSKEALAQINAFASQARASQPG
ncbi:short-chain dehydrogenase/reductase SDR [Novosphingobium sp. Rr 2-17]|uniref:SDR family oxidoreductase n=1 Tax=Novosphingobium sp. Rr 2-17 TaxID=555793 RepID=UPI00026994D7|nr:SDR family NAD(P)-dependent oxidoreductase [Novosphingobium sp. Rr 2-17]EIZ80397.1 short-chain dehydrogenase/reductase SDR [Novosphingobium sp. Rr 2-17]